MYTRCTRPAHALYTPICAQNHRIAALIVIVFASCCDLGCARHGAQTRRCCNRARGCEQRVFGAYKYNDNGQACISTADSAYYLLLRHCCCLPDTVRKAAQYRRHLGSSTRILLHIHHRRHLCPWRPRCGRLSTSASSAGSRRSRAPSRSCRCSCSRPERITSPPTVSLLTSRTSWHRCRHH